MRIKKVTVLLCASMFLFTSVCPVFADTVEPPYEEESYTQDKKTEEVMNLTVVKAVEYALENNCTIKVLDNKIALAVVASNNAERNAEDFEDAEDKLKDASRLLAAKRTELMAAQEGVAAAQKLLNEGKAPSAILVEGVGTIPAKDNIKDFLTPRLTAAFGPVKAAEMVPVFEANILVKAQISISTMQKQIDENLIAYNEAAITLQSKQDEFKYTLNGASEKIGVKIDYNSIVEFDVDEASELMISMAGVNLDVTRYAKAIYRNQIAMLVQKNYYDVLYAEKVLELKRVAKERGETQYNILQLSYDNGMKAKDDLLLSKMYYDSTVIQYHLAEASYKNALFELHKNMNLDLETEITLNDNMITEVTEDDLEVALKLGRKNRIEIQQILGQIMIYKLNEEILATKYKYRESNDVNNEARLLLEASKIELEQTQMLVETEINQSYVVMVAAGEMLKASEELIKNAEEVVEIAQIKYDQGFGAENSLLKQMNLGQSSGTILELIAAQENLVSIQAQVAQIKYSYTMAKIKYFNDAGILVY